MTDEKPTTTFLNDLTLTMSLLPAAQLQVLQDFIGGIIGNALRPIIKQEIDDAFKAFKSTSEIGEQNASLEKDWNSFGGHIDP